MKIEMVQVHGTDVAVIESERAVIVDTGSALDLVMSVTHETGVRRIAINREAVTEDFFRLNTCLAVEILQKMVNYEIKLAIYGDYSGYTSKPLHDFIYESNRGKDIFFPATREEAVQMLAGASLK